MDSTLIGDILAGVFGTVVVGTTAAVVHSVVGKDKAGKDDKKSGEEVQKGEFEAHSSEGDEELKGNGVVEVESFWKGPKTEGVPNPMVLTKDTIPIVSNRFLPINSCVPEGAFTLSDRQYKSEEKLLSAGRYLKAGPKTHLYYDPNKVRAAIVTCGGLCPGENVVVRELVMMLWYSYGVKDIYGVKYGYEGFWKIKDGKDCYVKLVPDFGPHIKNPPKDIIAVKDIHNIGGTILGSSRGGFDGERIADAIQKREINQIYAIGGDGTHRALLKLSKVFKKRGVEVTLIGIPKTIDNDMPLLDKTFGFDSAVEAAMWAIQCVDVEANSAEYGVGLIKVMGRSAGHIAMHAALANRDVNVCLLPEFPFDVYGPKGLLEYVMKRVKDRHHCVIVVAEGAALGMRDMKLGEEVRKDPSGNVIPEDIGKFLQDEIPNYGREKYGLDITLKYVDPSYILRAVAPNSSDKCLCAMLSEYAVHAAMAGYTNCTVGILRSYSALIPFEHIARASANLVRFNDRNWQRLLQSTGQPPFLNEKQ